MTKIIPFKRKPSSRGNYIRQAYDPDAEIVAKYRHSTNVGALATLSLAFLFLLAMVAFIGAEIARYMLGGW